MGAAAVVERHRAAGREFTAAGVRSFVREAGEGEAVVCVHGVPASSFTWRKVLGELAREGLRGVAFDLPGLGLAARPRDFDYSWTGLGRWCVAAVDALGLDRFHLVVHDIGGPVGFELAASVPERVRSLTVLNTMVEVDAFRRPWMMAPFARPIVGELWLASMARPLFRALMRYAGIGDRRAVADEEIDAYLDLLRREDGGRAFLRIMRGFERTAEKRERYRAVVRSDRYPVQVVWGADDPALPLRPYGEQAARAAGVELQTVPARHFLQEDQAAAVAARVAALSPAAG
jgi:pimeloyl-ACP methyl ester carboxylesterase